MALIRLPRYRALRHVLIGGRIASVIAGLHDEIGHLRVHQWLDICPRLPSRGLLRRSATAKHHGRLPARLHAIWCPFGDSARGCVEIDPDTRSGDRGDRRHILLSPRGKPV